MCILIINKLKMQSLIRNCFFLREEIIETIDDNLLTASQNIPIAKKKYCYDNIVNKLIT